MYTAYLILNNRVFSGTLDFYVLMETQNTLKKMGKNLKIVDIFNKIAEQDMEVISTLILQSLMRKNNNSKTIKKAYTAKKTDKELIEYFIAINSFIIDLLEECMPKTNKKLKESEFEDIPSAKDWDIASMEYIWTTVLRRNNFWKTTPKNYFEQVDVYCKLNNKKKNKKIEEI